MNTAAWICQGLLAITFLYSGIMKSTQQREKLVEMGQTGVDGLSYPLIRFIGISEIAGAFGIILPRLLNVLPVLTPVASLALCIIMIPAAFIHYKRNEMKSVAVNIMILLVGLFVAGVRMNELK